MSANDKLRKSSDSLRLQRLVAHCTTFFFWLLVVLVSKPNMNYGYGVANFRKPTWWIFFYGVEATLRGYAGYGLRGDSIVWVFVNTLLIGWLMT